ncbi:acyl-CoA dehydrogenase family protein [Haloechinothrix sp. LS1_15]|uniref:acyl-CoA dehydrogenase family protein n=1 Tax=Haloechinothrix sp. LS1_15 TaxID=2652248 RepID=UPI0029477476|nr:acyl-CoA dehydrogenase family protein [Haloechinothrix sp. LS1_15]MDV6012393.1 acyl-CoA dehydrogenase [Haloechinothrix sp. LS1_15]
MPATWTEEQRAFAAAIDELCRKECGTRQQRDALTSGGREHHNAEFYAGLAELGWLGVGLPEADGGSGGGITEQCILLERTGYGLAPVGGYVTTSVVAGPYLAFGTEEQRRRMVSSISAGRVHAISMSEPEAGSDVGALSCRAEPVDGGFRINGQKTWCSNAHIADTILLVARTDTAGAKHEGLTMLEVPADAVGLEVRRIPTMGADEVSELYFTDCFVPSTAVIGQVDRGWPQLMAGLNGERLYLASAMLGRAKRAFDDTVFYIGERHQFGRPIGSFQALSHRVADLATELECAELLVYSVAQAVDADPERLLPRQASMAKLKATETAKRVALEGMQMMGGYGYSTEYDMESHLRATVVSTVYGGTSEIQRDIIARTYGL